MRGVTTRVLSPPRGPRLARAERPSPGLRPHKQASQAGLTSGPLWGCQGFGAGRGSEQRMSVWSCRGDAALASRESTARRLAAQTGLPRSPEGAWLPRSRPGWRRWPWPWGACPGRSLPAQPCPGDTSPGTPDQGAFATQEPLRGCVCAGSWNLPAGEVAGSLQLGRAAVPTLPGRSLGSL